MTFLSPLDSVSYFFFLHTIGPNDLLHPLEHIFKLSRDFLSALPSVPVSELQKAMLQMKHFTSFFFKFLFGLLANSFFYSDTIGD
jgi:hypothetical protein